MRTAEIARETRETKIKLSLNLDGNGTNSVHTGVGFFDHMLELLSVHSDIDLAVECRGDTQVDFHHSVEDVGICLGQAFKQALGDKKGIARFADRVVPMDECAALVAKRASPALPTASCRWTNAPRSWLSIFRGGRI